VDLKSSRLAFLGHLAACSAVAHLWNLYWAFSACHVSLEDPATIGQVACLSCQLNAWGPNTQQSHAVYCDWFGIRLQGGIGVAGTVCLCGVIRLKQQSQQRCCLSVCKLFLIYLYTYIPFHMHTLHSFPVMHCSLQNAHRLMLSIPTAYPTLTKLGLTTYAHIYFKTGLQSLVQSFREHLCLFDYAKTKSNPWSHTIFARRRTRRPEWQWKIVSLPRGFVAVT